MTELPLFPVTVVGSLPRPPALLAALRKQARGPIDSASFDALADDAVRAAVRVQEEAGVDIVSDGEQRRDNFYSFIARKVDGVRLLTLAELLDHVEDKAAFEQLLSALDVPAFAIRNPVVDGRVRRREPLALDDLRFLRSVTHKPTKVCLPGPYLLTRSMWVKSLSAGTYPTKEALGDDVVAMLREEIADLVREGCDFVQLDEPVLTEIAFAGPHATHSFMCAALSEKASPADELAFAAKLVNQVFEGHGDAVRTGVHVCRGNWSQKEDVLLSGAYDPLVPTFSAMHVRQLVLEYATDRAGSPAVLRGLPADRELGFGCVNPRVPEPEPVAAIVSRVEQLLEHVAPNRVFLNPDCGFGTFADRPMSTMEVAASKLRATAEAAAVLRRNHG